MCLGLCCLSGDKACAALVLLSCWLCWHWRVLCWDLPRHSSAPGQKVWMWVLCVRLCNAAPGGRTPRSVSSLCEHGQLFSAQQWWRVYVYVKRSSSSLGGGSVSIRFSLSWGFLSVEWGPVFDVSLTQCPGTQQTEREPPVHHLPQNLNKASLPKELLIQIFDWLCSEGLAFPHFPLCSNRLNVANKFVS